MNKTCRMVVGGFAAVFAIVLFVLSMNTFNKDISAVYEMNAEYEYYGGDAYTGIQNASVDTAKAAAATARRVNGLNNIVAYVGGGVLLMGSFAFFIVALSFLAKHEDEVIEAVREQEDGKAAPLFWVCQCGTKNAEHAVSCKDCGNGRVGTVVRGDSEAYKKCACGAMVKHGERCPLCDEMVY